MKQNITEYIEGMIADRVNAATAGLKQTILDLQKEKVELVKYLNEEQEKIQKLQKRNYYLQRVLDGHGIKLVFVGDTLVSVDSKPNKRIEELEKENEKLKERCENYKTLIREAMGRGNTL